MEHLRGFQVRNPGDGFRLNNIVGRGNQALMSCRLMKTA